MIRMNSTILKENSRFLIKTGLLILLILSACTPAAATATPSQIQKTATASLPTPTVVFAPTATSTPVEDVVYPYYLPLATKLESASQTIDGVTAQIDWVYVDEGRVALQYTVSGLDWPDGSMLDNMQQVQVSSPSLSESRFGGFSGAGSANVSDVQQGVITGISDQALLDGALDAEKSPEINLNVDIPVQGPTKIGTFHFNFNAPVANGIKIENIDQIVVANNVSMTLKSLVLNPSNAKVLVCFQMPSSVDWGLMASLLTVNGRDYLPSGSGLAQGPDGRLIGDPETNRCSEVQFDISHDKSAASITLTVPKLMGSVPELIDEQRLSIANQRLADKGIEFDYVSVDHGGNFVILKRPDAATDEEIYPLIWDALAEQYEGPWVFTVPIPQ